MDNEPNNSLDDAEFLTHLSMTGGGSINSIITGETLHSDTDPIDVFYFTHNAGLKQVTVNFDLTTVNDRLDDGGVYGETRLVSVTPFGAVGDAISVERVVGADAYGESWTALWQALFAAALAVIQSDADGALADAQYGLRVVDLANRIFETDGVNVDPYALGQLLEAEAGASVFTSEGAIIRDMAGALGALYKKWETPIYRDPVTKAELGSGAKTVTWNPTGQATAFSVSGALTLTTSTSGLIADQLNVPSIQIFVKSEEGSKVPTPGNDDITGTAKADLFDMLAGNDTVNGGKGNDTIFGNVGDDSILGGDGNDVLDGGPGQDTIDGGAGNDIIRGGSENDRLLGGNGKDNIDAFAGDDFVDGGADNDTVFAGSGNDTVAGGAGNDSIRGDTGDDSITGDAGNDKLLGDDGNDTIDGGAGNDSITGGLGADSLTGGAGNDTFIYTDASQSRGGAMDVITDFDRVGNDRIDLKAVFGGTLKYRGVDVFSAAGQVRIQDDGSGDLVVQVNLDSDTTTAEMEIRLQSTSLSIIKADDFFL